MNAADLLAVWERGRLLQPLRRAQLFSALGAAQAERADTNCAALPVGASSARILDLRRAWFGSDIAAVTACPSCDARLEIAMHADDFSPASDGAQAPGAIHSIEVDGQPLHFRLPTLDDLEALDSNLSEHEAQDQLLHACVREPGTVATAHAADALLAEMARLDPLADPELALSCDACGHHFTMAFDIAAFLWCEIEAWSARLLGDIHAIASAYGWSEAEIIALPATRRRVYLDLICA